MTYNDRTDKIKKMRDIMIKKGKIKKMTCNDRKEVKKMTQIMIKHKRRK